MHELRVGLGDDDALAWVETERASADLRAYFEQMAHYTLPNGDVADVCLDLADWVTGVASRLDTWHGADP